MTLETFVNVPAQLIINGKTIDVMVQSVTSRDEENHIIHEEKYRDSVGNLFVVPHIVGKEVETITTFECVKREYARVR